MNQSFWSALKLSTADHARLGAGEDMRRFCRSMPARAATAILQVPNRRGGTCDGLYRLLRPLADGFEAAVRGN
jgi:hypothetical protein